MNKRLAFSGMNLFCFLPEANHHAKLNEIVLIGT